MNLVMYSCWGVQVNKKQNEAKRNHNVTHIQNEAACHPYYTPQQLWRLVSASKHLKLLVAHTRLPIANLCTEGFPTHQKPGQRG